jgi:hypothetical protein
VKKDTCGWRLQPQRSATAAIQLRIGGFWRSLQHNVADQLDWLHKRSTHKKVEIRDWLRANSRIHVHFTPTSGSWLNLVEVWFGIIERQAIHRGSFGSVKDLNTKIRAFIDGWNDRCHPFVWTKTAEQILKKANRQTISNTDH